MKRTQFLIPCLNEENCIADVIGQIKKVTPQADILVCDNGSTDKTALVAEQAGAEVIQEPRRGKGNAMRRLFAQATGEICVMVDGDNTYDLTTLPSFLQHFETEKLDFMNIARETENKQASYPRGHLFGNWLLSWMVMFFFRSQIKDVLSGYKIFSRRFIEAFPARSTGFEIETELVVFSQALRLAICETSASYRARPRGSVSKLSTYRDGLKILSMILRLVKEERPLLFFSIVGAALGVIGLLLFFPILYTYFHTGLVPRLPTVVVVSMLFICAFLSFMLGVLLDVLAMQTHEQRWQVFLRK